MEQKQNGIAIVFNFQRIGESDGGNKMKNYQKNRMSNEKKRLQKGTQVFNLYFIT